MIAEDNVCHNCYFRFSQHVLNHYVCFVHLVTRLTIFSRTPHIPPWHKVVKHEFFSLKSGLNLVFTLKIVRSATHNRTNIDVVPFVKGVYCSSDYSTFFGEIPTTAQFREGQR